MLAFVEVHDDDDDYLLAYLELADYKYSMNFDIVGWYDQITFHHARQQGTLWDTAGHRPHASNFQFSLLHSLLYPKFTKGFRHKIIVWRWTASIHIDSL